MRFRLRYWFLRMKCVLGMHTRYSTWCTDCGERSWVCLACRKADLE